MRLKLQPFTEADIDQLIACYERAGFRREGALRDHRRIGDEYWTLILMSIPEDEWRALA